MPRNQTKAPPSRQHELVKRASVLFLNFFLIILAHYQVKSASRSLIIETWGSSSLPYVWIVSALVLATFIGFYHRLVSRYSRIGIVTGSLVLCISLLVVFRFLLGWSSAVAAFGFYIFVDIFSVILVEQFWSLANAINKAQEGRKSYWFVGSGGLCGSVVGGALAAVLLRSTGMQTSDLLLSCAVTLGITLALNLAMARAGLYREVPSEEKPTIVEDGWRALVSCRYLLLIAGVLFCAQLAQPIVEYQFLNVVEAAYPVLDERTAFISAFGSILGLVSLGVNLTLTPLVHRYLGVVAGLTTQPLLLAAFSFGFMVGPTLWVASAMSIADRGLSYSINRASKEQLYIPIDPVHIYQAKAWIDMLGYRLFKVAGSAIILLLTGWLPVTVGLASLSWLTIVICAVWMGFIGLLAREYKMFSLEPIAAAA